MMAQGYRRMFSKLYGSQREKRITLRETKNAPAAFPIYRFAKHVHASASLERCWGRQENNEVSDYMLVIT